MVSLSPAICSAGSKTKSRNTVVAVDPPVTSTLSVLTETVPKSSPGLNEKLSKVTSFTVIDPPASRDVSVAADAGCAATSAAPARMAARNLTCSPPKVRDEPKFIRRKMIYATQRSDSCVLQPYLLAQG